MQTIVKKTKEKGAGLWASFKKFAFKGNVIDMAVGVIIGGAFSKIVTSLVNDLVMPLIGMLTAGQDFKELKWVLSAAVVENGEVVKPEAAVMYGSFLQNVLDFFLVAVTVFMAVKILTFRRGKKRTGSRGGGGTEKGRGRSRCRSAAERAHRIGTAETNSGSVGRKEVARFYPMANKIKRRQEHSHSCLPFYF